MARNCGMARERERSVERRKITNEDLIELVLKQARRVDSWGHNLSDWDKDFVESCLRRLVNDHRPLSVKQREILQRLDDTKVS